ncbi:MAG TPA: SpoIID/LytB domain-containing protein [Jatrophihabitans sp.]|nr:SpoIID/LytB domain-containing protein [Jatrophihabitans sp.]
MSASTRFIRKSKAILAVTVATAGTVAGVGLVTAAPAHAWASATVDITGHGYGHGRGMGQWGAYGYAIDYGWNYTQILSHYYGGTTLRAAAPPAMTVDLTGLDGTGSLTVTSGAPFTAAGVAVAAGGAARITYVGTNAFYVQTKAGGCAGTFGAARRVSTSLITSSVAAPSAVSQMLTECTSQRSYRGTLDLTYGSGATRVVNALSMDDYLKGVVPRESPASWGDSAGGKGMAALQSQAVAARSYATVSNRYSWAKICDSQNCQVYGGAGLNGALIEDPRTNNAVASTSGKVLTNSAGAVVSAEYSASTGGWTAGGTFPAVQDLGDVESPYHDWSASIPAATVGSTFGVGTLSKITVTRNGLGQDGGRVLSVTLTGSAGTDTETGASFAGALGLKSDWFSIKSPVWPVFYLTNTLVRPGINIGEPLGLTGDLPLACDWAGHGVDLPTTYRASTGTFYWRTSFASNAPISSVKLGGPGALPICGDWDGNGTDTPGVYYPQAATFVLMNTSARTASTPLSYVLLGGGGALPVAGDWNGDGKDSVGVFDPRTATWALINTLANGVPRTTFRWGLAGDQPLAGDWDGNGTDTPAIFRGGKHFAITNDLINRTPSYFDYGLPGDIGVAGDWNADHKDTVGVGRFF